MFDDRDAGLEICCAASPAGANLTGRIEECLTPALPADGIAASQADVPCADGACPVTWKPEGRKPA